MRGIVKWSGIVLSAVIAALFAAWATSPDPQGNPASFEDSPVDPSIAPLPEAITLASYPKGEGGIGTMVVARVDGETVYGVDLATLGAQTTGNPLTDLGSIDRSLVSASNLSDKVIIVRSIGELLPAAPAGERHIGTGTNFPEHAEEASSNSVFQFPKFGAASPARTTVQAQQGILLDYEVELCMRFDRDIATLEDFDRALKGVFLCGDFTNRNALVELADPDNLDSGYGFSDAKSGPDFYPTGPFVVVPNDWSKFVRGLRMTTSVNGERRQDARGGEMTMDFRELAARALQDMREARFYYGGDFFKLAPDANIGAEMTLMSGTAEGVIFTPPARADYIEGVLGWIATGGPLSDTGVVDAVKRRFIANELRSGHFLQPGDIVRHDSNLLGNIEVRVIEP